MNMAELLSAEQDIKFFVQTPRYGGAHMVDLFLSFEGSPHWIPAWLDQCVTNS